MIILEWSCFALDFVCLYHFNVLIYLFYVFIYLLPKTIQWCHDGSGVINTWTQSSGSTTSLAMRPWASHIIPSHLRFLILTSTSEPTVSVPLGNLLKVQILGPTPNIRNQNFWRWGLACCFNKPSLLMHTKVFRTTVLTHCNAFHDFC